MLDVGVIGTGYVGLVTGACLSALGHNVLCLDTDNEKIARLWKGEIPIFEPGLDRLVATSCSSGHLRFTSDLGELMAMGADVLFVAVGTPADATEGGADLTGVERAVKQVAEAMAVRADAPSRFTVIVVKSTVPVGTNRRLAEIVATRVPRAHFAMASNPEFLREGNAVSDFMKPDRIVIGSRSERAREVLEELYRPLLRAGVPLFVTSTVETAELIKYAANAFLATKITFINELTRLCEATGADVQELSLGVGLDHRIGSSFLAAGPGFGGSCFPKDLRSLVKTAGDFRTSLEIVETVIRANERHKVHMVSKIRDALGGAVGGRRLGVLGLSFKADTDDMRHAPSLTIVPLLLAEGAKVTVYDPIAMPRARVLLPGVRFADSIESAVRGADAIVVLTEWSMFRSIPWRRLAPTMRRALLIDLRNIYDPEAMLEHGMQYVSLGRQTLEEFARAAAE